MSRDPKDVPITGGVRRQLGIYLDGLTGKKPVVPVDMAELEGKAGEVMSPEGFAYVAGGAGVESTANANRKAFDRWRIVPRMLVDVSARDTSVELFGKTLPSPVLLGPIGVQEMAHEEADIATARAAAEEGIPMIFSNQASKPMEACAEAMGDSPRWFQLYWSKSDALNASLVSRAQACGCSVIVVTLDTTMLGWRIRDLDLAYLPFLRGKGLAQYLTDPVFLASLKEPPEENIMAAVQQFLATYSQPSLGWENISVLRDHTTLPLVLKGILHPDDGRRAVDHGMDGVIVSNHGGRQVDGAIGALDALPGVVQAIRGKIPVLFDSGIRGGADIFKALALGAKAACIGRPFVYGLAVAGQAGVQEVVRNMTADFELTMGLAGCTSVAEITPETIVRLD
ncbi:MAG: lactate 2-monooxygenase [Candidatus Binatia bacterium]